MQLSERQQAAVATAITILAAMVILGAVAGLLWMIGQFLQRFSAVFLPLAVGAVAALVFSPYYRWLRDQAKFPTALALSAVFLSLLVPLVAFFWFFGALAVEQVTEAVS